MKVNKLDPCPFCGGEVKFNYNLDLEPDGITCMKCSGWSRHGTGGGDRE